MESEYRRKWKYSGNVLSMSIFVTCHLTNMRDMRDNFQADGSTRLIIALNLRKTKRTVAGPYGGVDNPHRCCS